MKIAIFFALKFFFLNTLTVSAVDCVRITQRVVTPV